MCKGDVRKELGLAIRYAIHPLLNLPVITCDQHFFSLSASVWSVAQGTYLMLVHK